MDMPSSTRKRNDTDRDLKYSGNELDPILSMQDVAVRLGVSRATVYSLMDSPGFVTFKVGRQRRMRQSTLNIWVQMMEESDERSCW